LLLLGLEGVAQLDDLISPLGQLGFRLQTVRLEDYFLGKVIGRDPVGLLILLDQCLLSVQRAFRLQRSVISLLHIRRQRLPLTFVLLAGEVGRQLLFPDSKMDLV
jgi:hypothetical protein